MVPLPRLLGVCRKHRNSVHHFGECSDVVHYIAATDPGTLRGCSSNPLKMRDF